MRVLVAGWVGSTNLGDELVLRVLQRRLSAMGASVATISRDPATTRLVHGLNAIPDRDPVRMVAAAEQADLLVFGGGGLLQDATSALNLPYHLSRVVAARRAGTPVVAIGLGASSLTTRLGRLQVARALGAGTADPVPISVRDAPSAEVLTGLGIRPVLAADLAFGPELVPDVPTDVRDVVVVCLRPWTGGGRLPAALNWRRGLDDAVAASLAADLDDIVASTGLPVELVALQAGRDDRLNLRIAEHMRHTDGVRLATPSLDDLLSTVGSGRVVVSMRLHGGIAGALAGRPTLLLDYAPKVANLGADLALEVLPTGRGDVLERRRMANRVAAAVAAGDDVGERTLAAVERLRERERRSHDLLAETLARL